MAIRTPKIYRKTSFSAESLKAQRTALASPEAATVPKDVIASQQKILDAQPGIQLQQTTAATQATVKQSASLTMLNTAETTLTRQQLSAASDKLLEGIKFSHQMWTLSAHFQNISIQAVSAIGTPGCLDGPELAPMTKMSPQLSALMQSQDPIDRQIAAVFNAIIDAVSENYRAWQDQVTVPGLPWYPAFAAYPGPTAPPMPNVPVPLITCVSSQMGKITVGSTLKTSILNKLSNEQKNQVVNDYVSTAADVIAMGFMLWMPAATVSLVMGTGPVPSFAPPYVPVGPVVMGYVLPSPGHLAGAATLGFPLKVLL